MTETMTQGRLARTASIQGISAGELAARLLRHAGGFTPAWEQAAADTAGLPASTVSQMAYDAMIAGPQHAERAAALAEIAADRFAAERS
jgi:hypothetical protein